MKLATVRRRSSGRCAAVGFALVFICVTLFIARRPLGQDIENSNNHELRLEDDALSSPPPRLLSIDDRRPFAPWLQGRHHAIRGIDAVTNQLASPIQCVQKSTWRGPYKKGVSVEDRLDKALNLRSEWGKNLAPVISRCGNGNPMMLREEVGLLFHLLRRGDLMLEWGSGRSSCVWAHAVGELHSVDDSSDWVHALSETFNMSENQIVHWMPSLTKAKGRRAPSALDQFNWYVDLPFRIAPTCFPEFSNVKYDVILVDGRARPQCAYQALLLLKTDGVLLVHDFETLLWNYRPHYRIVMRWFELLHTEKSLGVFRIRPERTGPEHYSASSLDAFPSWWRRTQNQSFFYVSNEEPYDYALDEPMSAQEYKPVVANWLTKRDSKRLRK